MIGKYGKFVRIVTLALLVGACADESAVESGLADAGITVYVARDIVTMDAARPSAEAIAVSEEKIVAVGSLDEVRRELGDSPYVVDDRFKNHFIVPGLIDQHVHPLLAAISMSMEIIAIEDWVLPDGTRQAATGRDDYLARLSAAESGLEDPDEPLFSWGFHHYFHGKLTRQDLDAISATRPILVWHRSAHEFVLNSSAMDLFGITDEFYASWTDAQRDQSNFEEGHFWEQGWYPVLYKAMPTLAAPERLVAGLQFVENYLHASGITLIAEPGGIVSKDMQDAQNSVLSDEDTPFRSYFIVDGKTLATTQLDNLIAASESVLDWGSGKTAFMPKQVKLFADGAVFSQAMQMIDGYTDGHDGEWMMDLGVFAEAFNTYWDAGYQIHVHQNGDAGLEMVLDLLEATMERNPRQDHRTTIVHFAFSKQEQVERIARLGAIVSGNPYYLTALSDNYGANGLDPERADEMVRLGDVYRAGVSFSLHSDMAMAPADPLFLVWSAVNRETVSGRVAGPDQRIPVEAALRAVTLDAAYSIRLEDEVGSLEPGKLANMTILNSHPYQVDPDAIKDIEIWGTMLEGRLFPLN